jgi:tetratricopeptide (TPR) repeat protein
MNSSSLLLTASLRLGMAAAACVLMSSTMFAATPAQVYVAGEFAQSQGDLVAATRYFGAALQSDPADVLLQRRVFELSLQSGDMDRAVKLATSLVKDAPNDSSLLLVLAVDAVRKSDWQTAQLHLESLSNAGIDGILGPVLKSWVAVGKGKPDEASDILAVLDKTPNFRPFAAEQRAWIALASGKWREASEAFAPLLGESGTSGSLRMRFAAASAAQRAGDSARATKILSGEAANQAHPWLLEARSVLASGKMLPVPVTDAKAGIAEMLRRVSLDLSRDETPASALGYTWLSARLSPGSPETILTLMDVMTSSKQGDQALLLLESLPKGEMSDLVATMARVRILGGLGKDKEVVQLLQDATRKWPDRTEMWTSLGDAHRNTENFDAAVAAYSKALALTGTPKESDWGLYFVRGISYERQKKWEPAEADLKQSLALKPNQASVLNYLGYSWLEQKKNLAEATRMIELALEQRPSDGAIVDSLGWALFLKGDVPKAVERLEEAIASVPNDPTVNEHLGDAYWSQGRILEARHRWQAALDAEPDAAQKLRLTDKLDFGLNETNGQTPAGQKPFGQTSVRQG